MKTSFTQIASILFFLFHGFSSLNAQNNVINPFNIKGTNKTTAPHHLIGAKINPANKLGKSLSYSKGILPSTINSINTNSPINTIKEKNLPIFL